jgi:DNA primase
MWPLGAAASSGALLSEHGVEHLGDDALPGPGQLGDDKTPSLVISPDKNLWRCFGACDVGGDPIAWTLRT